MTSNTVLITGASSGIGRATAHWFQRRSWNVIAIVRDPGKTGDLATLSNVLCCPFMNVGQEGLPPEAIAQVIYKTTMDLSWKLRSPAGRSAGLLLFLRWLLPGAAYRRLIHQALIR